MVQRGLSCADGAATARNERRDPSGSRLCRIPGDMEGPAARTAAQHNSPGGIPRLLLRDKVRPTRLKTAFFVHIGLTGRTFSRSHSIRPSRRQISRTGRRNMATLKPTTPLLTPNKAPLKPTTPLRPKNAPKTPISRPQRRRWFQTHTGTSEQRRWRFQTTGPSG